MTCVHLRELYQLCKQNDLKLGGSDLIRIVCKQCGEQEVCPSILMNEYDSLGSVSGEPPQAEGSETS